MGKRVLVLLTLLALVIGMVPMATAGAIPMIGGSDLSVTITDGVAYYVPGGTLTYTIAVTNTGPDAASGANVLALIPTGVSSLSWTAAFTSGTGNGSGVGEIAEFINLDAGGSVVYTVTATTSTLATDPITFAVSAGHGTDPDISNNIAVDADEHSIDLHIGVDDGDVFYSPGYYNNYEILVVNYGNTAVEDARVQDTFDPVFTNVSWWLDTNQDMMAEDSGTGAIDYLVDIAPNGGNLTFYVTATISSSATGPISTTATVTAPVGTIDSNSANDTSTDTDFIAVPLCDLGVTVSDSATTFVPGHDVTYTMTVSNAGPSPAALARVLWAQPAGVTSASWTAVLSEGAIGETAGSGSIDDYVNLAPNATITYTIVAKTDSRALTPLASAATIVPGLGTVDPDPEDSSSVDLDAPTPQAFVDVTKTDGVSKYVPGLTTTYTITVTNQGPSFAPAIQLLDELPAGIESATWSAVYTGEGSAGDASGTGSIAEPIDLASGGTAVFTVMAKVKASCTGDLVNSATVTTPLGFLNLNDDTTSTDTDAQGTLSDFMGPQVYRFYNNRTGTHFYTAGEAEKNAVLAKYGSLFTLEGPAYHAAGIGGVVPLYRFYNNRTGTHFYTAGEAEKNAVLAKYGATFTFEGAAYSVLPSAQPGSVPVYRFYNNSTGAHFYTSGESEKAAVLAKYPQYGYEGIAFYVMP